MSNILTRNKVIGTMKQDAATTAYAQPNNPPAAYVGYRNFYGSGKFKYFIYPDDSWHKSWGKKPFLGYVYADEPFYAVREAYTKGLVPINVTFGLIALKEKLDEEQSTSRRFK